jgi:dTDP-4-dehydrorhamnose reductase
MKSILILGSQGMLGSSVTELFYRSNSFKVHEINRTSIVNNKYFDASSTSMLKLIEDIRPEWIINCVGVIKPYINDQDLVSTKNAFKVNSEFPKILNQIARETNARVIQIATDCVYSGAKGNYSEGDTHDPVDIYGESKSLGEIESDYFMNLRCSIVGRDQRNNKSLLEWFLSQKQGAKVTGYLDHLWNGITTNAFARICRGIIEDDLFVAGTFHQVPSGRVSKAELLEIFKDKFNRPDLIVEKKLTGDEIDRTLITLVPEGNLQRWLSAGYSDIPTIKALIGEL